MRIVHVGKFYPPEYQGGLESVVVGINRELLRRGIDVTTIVAAVHGGPRIEMVEGVEVRRVLRLATIFSQPLTPGLALTVMRTPGDILHLHHPNPVADGATRADRRPMVITHHSDIVRQSVLAPFYGTILRGALARARGIAVGSEQLLRSSPELRGFEAKVRVIPYGIESSAFARTPTVEDEVTRLRKAWGPSPVVLAVGRLVGYKGFDVLIRAAANLDAKIVIAGSGPDESKLRALAGPNVLFAGRISDASLVAHYHACDVFCLPSISRAEAFGIVLLEAMACSKPLVTTSLPTGVSAVNRDGITGIVVPPGEAGPLREALQALLWDGSLRERMGKAAREVQGGEYTASLMGERYVDMYHDALAS
jgi:glycosyltransferase involved in cell wall biosynthesis